jgi:hypothetical protein
MIGRKIRIVFLPPQTATAVFGSTTLCMNPAGFQLQAGGRRAAEIYSLIESAKLNGLNPQHYLAELLVRMLTTRRGALPNSCPGTGNARNHPRRRLNRPAHRTLTFQP